MFRSTLPRALRFEGRGLHSGSGCALVLRPAEPGTGRRFRRVDLHGAPEIPATVEHVVATDRSTRLARGAASVDTVEHALAALLGLGIDDAWLDVSGPEVPALDGSAAPLVRAIADAGGPVESAVAATRLRMERPVEVRLGESWVRLEPSAPTTPDANDAPHLEVDVEVDFEALGHQRVVFSVDPSTFARELAPARTFGFIAEVDALRARDKIRGADLDCVLVYGPGGVLNPEGLRFGDEVARHKVLDALGDLALVDARLAGRYFAHRPGHALNVELARGLSAYPRANAADMARALTSHSSHSEAGSES
jgi:UDP-3-O-[3-hydroxymyristoyl] N-acetylglucosamine deacetylase